MALNLQFVAPHAPSRLGNQSDSMDLYEEEYVRAELGKRVSALRDSQFLTDITILTAGGPIAAHRIILATHSSFFRAVCSTQWGSHAGAAQTVALKHVQHDVMTTVLDSIYQGRLEIDNDNALSVLSLALELDIQLVRLGAIKVLHCKAALSTNLHYTTGRCSWHYALRFVVRVYEGTISSGRF